MDVQIMPLEKADDQFMAIQHLIEAKRQFLLSKRNDISSIAKQNNFLADVKDDYERYFRYISDQKREQVKAFEILQSYIDKLKNTGILSQQNIEDSKVEQKKIMKELNSIKGKIDDIITETAEIQK